MEEKPNETQQQVEAPKEQSEQPQSKITVSPPKREKDPKRVAQGKRLAAISKEAKERKLREKIEAEKLSQQYFDYNSLQKNIFFLGAPITVFLGLYLLWNNRRTKENTVEHLSPVRQVTREPSPKPSTSNNMNKNYSLFD